MLTMEELRNATAFNDLLSDEGMDVDDITKSLGAKPEALSYIAEQRATIIVLAQMRGREFILNLHAQERYSPVELTETERGLIAICSSLFADGFACAMRASEVEAHLPPGAVRQVEAEKRATMIRERERAVRRKAGR